MDGLFNPFHCLLLKICVPRLAQLNDAKKGHTDQCGYPTAEEDECALRRLHFDLEHATLTKMATAPMSEVTTTCTMGMVPMSAHAYSLLMVKILYQTYQTEF